ncbi:L-aspartate oxidase [Shimia biformata]|uniref:L-aspartate oxidase n=1 Tax=Shimia biformata TaxID=1294299 RepID=UPI00194F03A4|nr:L-aspartate oxidase [Shimia biformata]
MVAERTIFTSRIVIVGAGMGALYAALELAPRPVLMISPDALGTGASSAWAQGGVAAAMGEGDSPAAHASDTVKAGAGTVDAAIAALVTEDARTHILDLTELGTPFDRTENGDYVMSREAAHSTARVVRVKGDQAGKQIMETLIAAVRQTPSVQVLEGVMATGLVTQGHDVTGVHIVTSDESRSAPVLIRAPAVLLAGGGSGGLYKLTTNPARIRGQVIGMAARAGARIADPEFVQFHPTAIDMGEDPAPLATEALRGEGAVLINRDGDRFMTEIHPDAELAPRDIVARAIFAQTQAGNHPALDTREALGARIVTDFPSVAEYCARAGIDPVTQPIPVAAAAHYHMGGVEVTAQGRASLGNLWVCGEAGASGLHGANRLASNGLLEALVFARSCARDISEAVPVARDADEVVLDFIPGGHAPDPDAVDLLRRTMTNHVGVVRDAAGLKLALKTIAGLEEAQSASPSFMNMAATATLIAAAALLREESRGGHFRSDFPQENPDFAHRTRITLQDALDLRRTITEDQP